MLKIEELSVYYGDRQILKNIELEVNSGEVVALIGPNGAGKSTLIRAVSGVIPIRSGRVHVNGTDLTSAAPIQRAQQIAVVPQAVSLPPAFTVWETVLLGRTPYLNFLGQTSGRDQELTRRTLEQVDMLHLAESRMNEISGGEQQRALLARALAQATPVLLMDEPTAHLDLRHQLDLLKLISGQARGKKLTVLVALHDLNLASLFADRIAIIEDGHLCMAGSPDETLTTEILRRVYKVPVHVIQHPENRVPLILPSLGD